jgi:hypothetical protein
VPVADEEGVPVEELLGEEEPEVVPVDDAEGDAVLELDAVAELEGVEVGDVEGVPERDTGVGVCEPVRVALGVRELVSVEAGVGGGVALAEAVMLLLRLDEIDEDGVPVSEAEAEPVPVCELEGVPVEDAEALPVLLGEVELLGVPVSDDEALLVPLAEAELLGVPVWLGSVYRR